MENESQEILKQALIQLREELIRAKEDYLESKRTMHKAKSIIEQCIKGFETIEETGNTRVAAVFLEELNDLWLEELENL